MSNGSIVDEVQSILEKRARLLAQVPETADEDAVSIDLAVVTVGDERYGIDVGFLREVRPATAVTPVPSLPPIWAGLINLRGNLCPVLDLARYLGVPKSELNDRTEVVVVEGVELTAGLLVDAVEGIQRYLVADIGRPLANSSGVIRGITPDFASVVDMSELLADPNLVVNDEIL